MTTDIENETSERRRDYVGTAVKEKKEREGGADITLVSCIIFC